MGSDRSCLTNLNRSLIAAVLLGRSVVWAQTTAPATDDQVIELNPVTVTASKDNSAFERFEQFQWHLEQFSQGDRFHIRGGQLVDAIIFCHDYLKQHPLERATVVVVTEPKYHRVTQAAAAYTAGKTLRLASSALGDIAAGDLTAADIDAPEKIQRYIQGIRKAYLKVVVARGPLTMGMIMAAVEESGNYKHAGPLYSGTSESMLDATFHWLSDPEKAGLIPISYSKIKVNLVPAGSSGKTTAQAREQEAIVFDWDDVHYLYNDEDGTLALPLPKNPVTGTPCLVLRNGDVLESLYFVAVYAKLHPSESTAFVPPLDGLHAAAAFTASGKLYLLSPFLGRFALPPPYHIENKVILARVHAALVAQEQEVLTEKKLRRSPTSMPQEMPGDSEIEQLRRAYLALKEVGVPVKFIEGKSAQPGLHVSYEGTDYTYIPPASSG